MVERKETDKGKEKEKVREERDGEVGERKRGEKYSEKTSKFLL